MNEKMFLKLLEREILFYREKVKSSEGSVSRFYQGCVWALEEVKKEISTTDPMNLGGIWQAIKDEPHED